MKQKQPILGKAGTLIFLVLISAFPPLTTDLYLPALPQMVAVLNTTQAMVNFTLSIYFVVYAMGLLFWGPLSEKVGRKPILLIGIAIYVVASTLCGLANNIELLITARIFQAFGGSAVTVIATAIVKDLYDGREREQVMATIMSLVIIAPMIAPVLGAFLLKIASWHMMFFCLAFFGVVCAGLSMCYQETLTSRYKGSILRSWGRLAVVFNNPRFITLLVIFSLVPMAMMSFLSAGAYIYIDGFGLTEQEFSYAFAFNALFASFGPAIYMKLSKRFATQHIITLCFMIVTLCGVLTFTVGELSPWIFAFIVAPTSMAVIVIRVPGTNLMLDQQNKDTGSAVAIIQFVSMMSGATGMMLVVLNPESMIQNLGTIQFMTGLISGALWLKAKNKPFITAKLTFNN
ncbi:multidrug effflux MFS transporter [Shewanella youngdeokensis]|uniref:Bcr/CflA family efflux transporter n=1 Tax=Shewanella youngdeokensis TaxID=2999068 RepID=A0ABZ0JW86_9GAMM|nr:multidrug effflux MFS transporter [Shewanella sp. DAU334]